MTTTIDSKQYEVPKLDFPISYRAGEIKGDKLLIYRNVRYNEPKADCLVATLDKSDAYLDGKSINFYDWKFNPETKTIYIRGGIYLGYGNSRPFETTLHANVYVQDVPKPNRSKNWEWNDFSGGWRNTKTGEKRSLLTC